MKYVIRSAILLVVLLTGCYSYGVRSGAPSDGVLRQQRGPTYLWGLVGQEKLAAQCDSGLARSETYMPWWGGIVGVISLGTILPWRVEYECTTAYPPTAEIEIEPRF